MDYWCNNTVMIVGSYFDVKHLEECLCVWEMRADFLGKKDDILSYISKEAGLKLSCHGAIWNTELKSGKGEDDNELFINYDSGYAPEVKFWQELVKKEAPSCKIYWYSYAPRRKICMTNDTEKKYFDFDYVLDINTKEYEHPLAKEFGHDSITTIPNDKLEKELRNVYGNRTLEEMVEMVKNEDFDGFHIYKVTDGSYFDTKE